MKLEELKKKLYKPEAEFEKRLEAPEPFQPEKKREKILIREWRKEKPKKKLSEKQKKHLLIGGISLGLVFLLMAGFFIWRGLTSFDKSKVELEISGPERVVGGEEIKYIVKYKNNTRLALKNVKLVFNYPEGSVPSVQGDLVQTIDLPDLAAGQQSKTELLVRIIGLRGEVKKAWAELSYQPGSFSSQYANRAEFSSTIISVPLILDFDLPERLVDGQSFSFSLKYLNQAGVSFSNLQIRIDYPAGFVFDSSNPVPLEEERIWSFASLMAGEQGKIFIRGAIQGEEGQSKLFKAQLGLFENDQFIPYTETVGASQISLSPLSVSQTVNGATDYIAQAGETLTYQIDYKNTTDVGIKNVVITSKLEGAVLDFANLTLNQGSFEGANQIITWKASNLPALEYLAPNQEGRVGFSVKIKDSLPVKNYTDKNFRVNNVVKIDSSEVPISLENIQITGQSQLTIKISSQMTLQAQGYYYDDVFVNSGPIPPKVGQTTIYTIKWRLVNVNNDLSGVKVEAFLPPHVQWLDKVSPDDVNLSYHSQTGRLAWQIGDLPSATGILLPVRQVSFQVAITPSLAHLGSFVELIGQSKVTGHDEFVDLELTSIDGPIDTDLPDDLKVSRQDGIVVE